MAAVQRIRQGVRALVAFSRPVDYELVADYLSPPLLALFKTMGRAEQQHSLNVLRDVLAQANEKELETPRDLAVAALLHDVGKTRYPLAVWQKTLAVLGQAALPSLARRWSGGDPRNLFLCPFVVYEQHPAWSAELAAEAGASEDAQWLIRHHQEAAEPSNGHALAGLLRRLQRADDSN